MEKRYYIDERSGCIAVRDRTKDGDSPGLHPDTRGVVQFWMGFQETVKCPTCGHQAQGAWTVPPETRGAAEQLAATLNGE